MRRSSSLSFTAKGLFLNSYQSAASSQESRNAVHVNFSTLLPYSGNALAAYAQLSTGPCTRIYAMAAFEMGAVLHVRENPWPDL